MTQDERRVYLLKSLLSEKEEYEKLTIPESVLGQKRLLRALFNVRAPAPVSQEFLDVQDAYLKEATAEKGCHRLPYAHSCTEGHLDLAGRHHDTGLRRHRQCRQLADARLL